MQTPKSLKKGTQPYIYNLHEIKLHILFTYTQPKGYDTQYFPSISRISHGTLGESILFLFSFISVCKRGENEWNQNFGCKKIKKKIENIVRGERRKSQICNVFSCNFLYDGVPDIALRY